MHALATDSEDRSKCSGKRSTHWVIAPAWLAPAAARLEAAAAWTSAVPASGAASASAFAFASLPARQQMLGPSALGLADLCLLLLQHANATVA